MNFKKNIYNGYIGKDELYNGSETWCYHFFEISAHAKKLACNNNLIECLWEGGITREIVLGYKNICKILIGMDYLLLFNAAKCFYRMCSNWHD